MKSTLAELAILVNGTFTGDGEMIITGAAPTHSAKETEITFIEKNEREYALAKSVAGAVLAPKDYRNPGGRPVIHVDEVVPAFEQIVKWFMPPRSEGERRISDRASIAHSARIGENVRIDPFAVIGENVVIGDDCTIHAGVSIMDGCKVGVKTVLFPGVVLYENTEIGARCILHAHAVIGAFGFGYDSSSGRHILSPQLGNVKIGDDVEIGACTTIDRATYGSTYIEEGTKIDNQVMIGHNCKVGRHNIICANVGIAGSTTTGDYVVMAGRVGVKDHVHIGTGAKLGAMAGIIHDIPAGTSYVGAPATPERDQKRVQIALAKLPEMRKEMKEIQKQIEGMKNKQG